MAIVQAMPKAGQIVKPAQVQPKVSAPVNPKAGQVPAKTVAKTQAQVTKAADKPLDWKPLGMIAMALGAGWYFFVRK